MIMTDQRPLFWNKDTEEKRWQMEEGFYPRWWLPRWPLFRPWRLGCLTVAVGADFWWSPRGALFSVASSCSSSTGTYSALSWFDSGTLLSVYEGLGLLSVCSAMLGPDCGYMLCVSHLVLLMSYSAENCGYSAVAVHRRSSISCS